MNIAIDIGYGDTKVFYKTKSGKENYFKFPTAVERVRGIGLDFAEDDEKIIEFKGLKYRVGDDVILTPFDTRTVEFLLKYSPLLVFKALKEIEKKEGKIDLENNIATGLSVLNWDKHQEFMNVLKKFFINDFSFKNNVFLFAQGQGIFFDMEDEIDKNGLIIVVDIGFNTLDVIVFENGKPLKNYSYALKFGSYLIASELKGIIEKKFKISIGEIEAKEVLNKGSIKIMGEVISFKDEIENLKSAYTEELILALKNHSEELLSRADSIIISGGGAYYISESELKNEINFKKFKNAILSKKPYEFSNVRGYFKAMSKVI